MATAFWFTPPSRPERRSMDRLFGRMSIPQGMTVIKQDGIYSTVTFPLSDSFEDAEEVYLGGHRYLIDAAKAAALDAAGYGEFIEDADTYGSGPFGEGDYS